jgi:acetyl esterase
MPLTQQAQAFLDAIAENNPPGWEQLSPQEGREAFDGFIELFGEGPDVSRVEDHTLPGDVKVRLYSDESGESQPAVMYFHGGGWVLGNIQTHDALCQRIAKASQCTVISVDYALAPENPFPKPLDDCYSAAATVARQASDFNIDPTRIAVAGDSAGGNLAAAVSIRARDQGGPSIKLQVLLYPVIEPDFDTESYRQFADSHGLTRANMQWFWEQYLGGQSAGPLAAINRADSLHGLPPAHVVTAQYDVLRDEGEAYARQLIAAGVPTTTKRYDGNLHGFVHFAGMFDDGLIATQEIAEVLKSHLCE